MKNNVRLLLCANMPMMYLFRCNDAMVGKLYGLVPLVDVEMMFIDYKLRFFKLWL